MPATVTIRFKGPERRDEEREMYFVCMAEVYPIPAVWIPARQTMRIAPRATAEK
jgi:hypothetical protein